MADTITCPACGEVNPADIEFCQNCQARLQPLTGPLKGEDAPIQPGQVPTKKVTSELEPVLPQWLREARQQARQSAEEETSKAEQEQKTTPISHGPDLLAGLASQSEEEDEETPEWLASITGAPHKKKKNEPEDTQVKRVELGHEDKPAEAPSDDESASLPWMRPQEAPPEKDELTEWFKQASASASDASTPLSTDSEPAPVEPSESKPPSSLRADNSDWLKNLEATAPDFPQAPAEPSSEANQETLDWLKRLDAETPAVEKSSSSNEAASAQTDVPDWLKNFGQESATPETTAPQSGQALPDWLKAAAPSGEEPPPVQSKSAADEKSASGELPDWIASLKPADSQASAPSESVPSVFKSEEPPAEPSSPASAFVEDSLSSGDVDAIFASMQMPDWLSDITPSQAPTEEILPPAAQSEEPIAPAELPSWVRAMRPVESAMPDSSAGPMDTTLETGGPLAGLHGVLPSVPGAATPSSKPKTHSIKLDATDQQQVHAALLEKILAAETAPIPMKAASGITSQRRLRWMLSLLLFFVLGGAVFGGTQIFPLPGGVPNETITAVQAVEAIPADAPVLAVFDYEPSTVGEMEATGASLMDHLLLLKHPRLALLSTSPTGAALAERFMSTTLAERAYQRGAQYVDLGYLPGGLAGVYDFAQNPTVVMPLGADGSAVWTSALLQGVTRLSDFAAVIVLTDNAESGRMWIEQAGPARGNASLVIVSSAQAGPMLLPYVNSGQINGLVAGINGAVGAEAANGGLPGFVRRYWDAYSLGLLLAVAAIIVGGLWNLWLGLQDRRAQEAG